MGEASDKTLLIVAALVFIVSIGIGVFAYNMTQQKYQNMPELQGIECGGHYYAINITNLKLGYVRSSLYDYGNFSTTQYAGFIIIEVNNTLSNCKTGNIGLYVLVSSIFGSRIMGPYIQDVSKDPGQFYFTLPVKELRNNQIKLGPNQTLQYLAASTPYGVWKTLGLRLDIGNRATTYGPYNITLVFRYDPNTGTLIESDEGGIPLLKSQNQPRVMNQMTMFASSLGQGNTTVSYPNIIKPYIGAVYASGVLVAAGLIGLGYLLSIALEGLREE